MQKLQRCESQNQSQDAKVTKMCESQTQKVQMRKLRRCESQNQSADANLIKM